MNLLDLTKLEQALKAQEVSLAGLLSKREGIAIESSPDSTDAAQFQLERELAARSLQREYDALLEVKLALRRIAEKSYGICQDCEESIGVKRLMAVPWTCYCIRCQEKVDAIRKPGSEREYRSARAA